MSYSVIPFQDAYERLLPIARTIFVSDKLSFDLYNYQVGNKLIVHQSEKEVHDQLVFVVIEGMLEVDIEDRRLELHEHEALAVCDIYLFEMYALSPCKFLFFTSGTTNINYDTTELRELRKQLMLKDKCTGDHDERISKYACQIMHVVDPEYNSPELSFAATYHDVGKINVPNEILNLPRPYTEEEWRIMRRHPQDSYDIICRYLPERTAQIALQHHEWMNGNGYPQHLKGDEIMLQARVLAVADMFDALVNDRPYRTAMPLQEALNVIDEDVEKGHLDAKCVSALKHLIQTGAIAVSQTE